MKLSKTLVKVASKELTIPGYEDSITIYPVTGFALLKMQDLSEKLKANPESSLDIQKELIRLTMTQGCKADPEDVEYLIENDLILCTAVVQGVMEYSVEYNEAKQKESGLAKKKLKK